MVNVGICSKSSKSTTTFGLEMGEISFPFVCLFEALASGEALFDDDVVALIGGDRVDDGEDFCLDVGGSLINGRDRLFNCLGVDDDDGFDDDFNGFVVFVVAPDFCGCLREVVGSESELRTISS